MDYYRRKQRDVILERKKQDFIKKMKYLIDEEVEFVYLMVYSKDLSKEKCFLISKGTREETKISSREIIKNILSVQGEMCMIVHNHPNGLVLPSPSDYMTTRIILEILTIADCVLLDHIIIGSKTYYSIKDKKELNYENQKDRRNLKKLGNIGHSVRRIRNRKNYHVSSNWKKALNHRL